MANIVYIAESIDNYIADKNNSIEFLEIIDNPNNIDIGFNNFLEGIDAIVMGRRTYETVLSFSIDWPYTKPVFVLSSKLKNVFENHGENVFILNKSPKDIVKYLNNKGYYNIYIDGGFTIQKFLKANLIDEMILTTIPIILGSGVPLFGNIDNSIEFELVKSEVLLNQVVSSTYKKRK